MRWLPDQVPRVVGKIPFQYFTAYALSLLARARVSLIHETDSSATTQRPTLLGFRGGREMTYRRLAEATSEAREQTTPGSGHRPTRITKLVMPHRMPKVCVPDIVQANYLDASPIMELLRSCLVTLVTRLIL